MLPLSAKPIEDNDRKILNHIYVLVGYVGALILLSALTFFSDHSLIQERFVLTMGILGLAIIYWITCFASKRESELTLTFRRPTLVIATPVLLAFMILAGTMGPLQQPLVPASEIPAGSIVRALFMIGVSAVLPGLLILSLINSRTHSLLRFVIAVHVSFAIMALMTYAIYFAKGSMQLMLPSMITVIAILWSLHVFMKRNSKEGQSAGSLTMKSLVVAIPRQVTINKWAISLALMVVAAIAVGFTFHDSQRYMIPGDAWRVLQPGVDLLAGRDISETTLVDLEYPIAYGFLMAGISEIAGIPIVNVNMFLFPFVAINLLSFYSLVRYVFKMRREIATISSFFYVFAGGLGWLMISILGMTGDFWTLSYKTQDMLFSYYTMDNMQFWHRTLAITFGFLTIITFYHVIGKEQKTQWALVPLAALFLVFAYMIHMLPLIFVVPVILYLWYTRAKHSWSVFFVFTACAIGIFAASDLLLSGYYSSLSIVKVSKELLPDLPGVADSVANSIVNLRIDTLPSPDAIKKWLPDLSFLPESVSRLGIGLPGLDRLVPNDSIIKLDAGFTVLATIAGLGTSLFTFIHRRKKGSKSIRNSKDLITTSAVTPSNLPTLPSVDRKLGDRALHFSSIGVFGLGLVCFYFYGIGVWSTFPQNPGLLYDINQLPWYFIPIRFGLVGLLAMASLFFIRRRQNWMGIALVWFVVVFVVGHVWWGPKILSFLYPVLAISAGYALYHLRENIGVIAKIIGLRDVRYDLARLASVGTLGALLILSTSSYVYGLSHYHNTPTPSDPSVLNIISWIYWNVPNGEKVVVYSQDYALEVGVAGLTAHDTLVTKDWNRISGIENSDQLRDLGLNYFVGRDSEVPKIIKGDAFPIYRIGNTAVLQLLPTHNVTHATILNKGSGSVLVTEDLNGVPLSKKWEITWIEEVGVTLGLDQSIPNGSKVSFDLRLDQSSWNTPSSVQELYVKFSNGGSEMRTANLLNELDRGLTKSFLIALDTEADQIELIAINGGSNNASMTISNLRYLTPDGNLISISTQEDLR